MPHPVDGAPSISDGPLTDDHVYIIIVACSLVGACCMGLVISAVLSREVRLAAVASLGACASLLVLSSVSWAMTSTAMRSDTEVQFLGNLRGAVTSAQMVFSASVAPGVRMAEAYRTLMLHTDACHAAFPEPFPGLFAMRLAHRGADALVGSVFFGNTAGYGFGVRAAPGSDRSVTAWYAFPPDAPFHDALRCRLHNDPNTACLASSCGVSAAYDALCPATCTGNTTGSCQDDLHPRRVTWTGPADAYVPTGVIEEAVTYDVREQPWFGFSAEPLLHIHPASPTAHVRMTWSRSVNWACVVGVDFHFTESVSDSLAALLPTPDSAIHILSDAGVVLATTDDIGEGVNRTARGGPSINRIINELTLQYGSLQSARALPRLLRTPWGTALQVDAVSVGGEQMGVVLVEAPVAAAYAAGTAASTRALFIVYGLSFVCGAAMWALLAGALSPVGGLAAAMTDALNIDRAKPTAPTQLVVSVFAEIRRLQHCIYSAHTTLVQAWPYLPRHLLTASNEEPSPKEARSSITGPSLAGSGRASPSQAGAVRDIAVAVGSPVEPRTQERCALYDTAMTTALDVYTQIVHSRILELGGYEVLNTNEGFAAAFHHAEDACIFGMLVQQDLLAANWPAALTDGRVEDTARTPDGMWAGLRVKIGVDYGSAPVLEKDKDSGSFASFHCGSSEGNDAVKVRPSEMFFDVGGATTLNAVKTQAAGSVGAVAVSSDVLQAIGIDRSAIANPIVIPCRASPGAPTVQLLFPQTLAARAQEIERVLAARNETDRTVGIVPCHSSSGLFGQPCAPWVTISSMGRCAVGRRSSIAPFADWCTVPGNRDSTCASANSSFSSASAYATAAVTEQRASCPAVWGERLQRRHVSVGQTLMHVYGDTQSSSAVDPYGARRPNDALARVNAALALVLDALHRTGSTVVSLTGMCMLHMWPQRKYFDAIRRPFEYVPLLNADMATMRVSSYVGISSGVVMAGNVGGRHQRFTSIVGPAASFVEFLTKAALKLKAKALYAHLAPTAPATMFPNTRAVLRPVDVWEVEGDAIDPPPYSKITVYDVLPVSLPEEGNPLDNRTRSNAPFEWSPLYWDAFERRDIDALTPYCHDSVVAEVRALMLSESHLRGPIVLGHLL